MCDHHVSDSLDQNSDIENLGSQQIGLCFPNLCSFLNLSNARELVDQHAYKCSFIGAPLLICGLFLYMRPLSSIEYGENLFYISLLFIFTGGICVWIPVFHWMTQTQPMDSYESRQIQQIVDQSPVVLRMKPPDYETLPPRPSMLPEAPPAYDEVYNISEENQMVIPVHRDAVTLCRVTRPRLTRSLSAGTLHTTDTEALLSSEC